MATQEAGSTMLRPLALVTGASSGIGHSLAKEFVRAGFDVLITGQHEGIHRVAEELEGSGPRVEAVQANLANREDVEALWSWAQAKGRPIDAAAINAGVGLGGPFADTSLDAE